MQLVTADFNGDGIADLAVVNSKDNTVSVLLGVGDGTFRAQVTYPAVMSVPFLSAEPVSAPGFCRESSSLHKQLKIENLAFTSALFFFLLLE